MVYDESKNYIGDSHWREGEELQEGTELKLDKGVLIDVQERIGETETDLAPLLDKRRPENASSPTRVPLQPISLSSSLRTNLGRSQARPKSLSDVLGLSQGPMGRARLPAQSPYEQRRQLTETLIAHREEPPAKRLRFDSGKENIANAGNQVTGTTLSKSRKTATPLTKKAVKPSWSERENSVPAKDIIDISSEEESPLLPSSLLRVTPQAKDKGKKRAVVVADKQSLPEVSISKARKRLATTSASSNKNVSSKPSATKSIRSSAISRDGSSMTSSTGRLRFAVHKPRRKLMYLDLLPPSIRPVSYQRPGFREAEGLETSERRECGALSTDNRNRLASDNESLGRVDFAESPPRCSPIITSPHQIANRNPGQARPRTKRIQSPSTDEPLDDISNVAWSLEGADVPTRRNGPPPKDTGRAQEVERELTALFTQSSSPLFMPHSPSRIASQVSEHHSPGGIFPRSPSPLLMNVSRSSPLRTTGPTLQPTGIAVKPQTSIVPKAALPSKLTLLGQQIQMPPPKISPRPVVAQPISPQPRSLRRVVSANDSPVLVKPILPSMMPVVATSKAAVLSNNPGPQAPFKSPIKLRKSHSDGAVNPKIQIPLAVKKMPDEQEVKQDTGPWSKTEAFLLFDWFPPGRERLILHGCEQDVQAQTVVKRGFLSDQIGAL